MFNSDICLKTSFVKEDYEKLHVFKNLASVKVYLMRNKRSEEFVVLKKISEVFTNKPEILQEVRIGQTLDAPHFAKTFCHHYNSLKNKHYLVMEYIPGITIKQYVEENCFISSDRAKGILKQILEGVKYCLEKQICPSDFHDDNLIIDEKSGKITFIDFGEYLEFPCSASPELGHNIKRVLISVSERSPIKSQPVFQDWKKKFFEYGSLDTPEEYIKWCNDLLEHLFLKGSSS